VVGKKLKGQASSVASAVLVEADRELKQEKSGDKEKQRL